MKGPIALGMTITEKLLARAAGVPHARPGEILTVDVSWCMTNDATTHISIDMFNARLKERGIHAPERTVFVIDHNVPSESPTTTATQNKMRAFAREHGIPLHDGEGVCHQLILEEYAKPGDVVFGADSHTLTAGAVGAFAAGVGSTDFVAAMVTGQTWVMVPPTIRIDVEGTLPEGVFAKDVVLHMIGDLGADGATYKAIEWGGPGVQALNTEQRATLVNMGVEAGAKSSVVEPDEETLRYLREKRGADVDTGELLASDPDCVYERRLTYDLSTLEPVVAYPHNVDNIAPVTAYEGTAVTTGFVGSCNSGRIEDLRIAAGVLRGRKVLPEVKLIVAPASKSVYMQALKEGLMDVFLESGAMVVNSNCSVCFGNQGAIGEGDVLISTGTRNFPGRSGSQKGEIFLASPATVAATCVGGYITDPREFV